MVGYSLTVSPVAGSTTAYVLMLVSPMVPVRYAGSRGGVTRTLPPRAKENSMHARVVRFTDVDPDHMSGRIADIEGSDGPPVDIPAKGIQILHDADQRTAVVIQLFENADDMATAESAL